MKRFRGLAVVGALWLVCVAAGAGVVERGQSQAREGLFDRFEARSTTGASFVAAYVADVFESETRLAADVGDAPGPKRFARATALMGFSAAVLLDPGGRAIALAPDNPALHGVEIASRYRHLSAALGGKRAVSDIVLSAVRSEPIVAFALPLSGGVAAVLSCGFALEGGPLKTFLARQPVAGTRGYILDSNGVVIVSAGDGSVPSGDHLVLPSAGSGPSVTHGRLVAASPVPGTSWTYVLDTPVAALLAPLSGSRTSGWALLVGLAALTLVGLMVAAGALASRARARERQAEADRRFRLTVEHAPIGMTMVSLDHQFVEPNNRLCRMLGYTVDELEQMTIADVSHPEDVGLDLVTKLVHGEIDHFELDKRYIRRDGAVLWGHLTSSVVRDGHGQPKYLVSQIEDVTSIRAAQEALEHRALYDPLTGLANRGLLVDRLTHALDATRKPVNVAVGFCDLDLFKQINDNHGHHAGDAVLKEVARRLRDAVRTSDTVARMGGDEFIILLTDVDSPAAARATMERAKQAAEQPIEVDGTSLSVGLSTGLALAQNGDTAETLLRNSDTALYAAKNHGRGTIEVYNPVTHTRSASHHTTQASHSKHQSQPSVDSSMTCRVPRLVIETVAHQKSKVGPELERG